MTGNKQFCNGGLKLMLHYYLKKITLTLREVADCYVTDIFHCALQLILMESFLIIPFWRVRKYDEASLHRAC